MFFCNSPSGFGGGQALEVVKRSIPVEIDLDYCKGCGICAEECPAKAIKMSEEAKE